MRVIRSSWTAGAPHPVWVLDPVWAPRPAGAPHPVWVLDPVWALEPFIAPGYQTHGHYLTIKYLLDKYL